MTNQSRYFLATPVLQKDGKSDYQKARQSSIDRGKSISFPAKLPKGLTDLSGLLQAAGFTKPQISHCEHLVPEIGEMPFWKAVTLVGTGHLEDALPIFAAVFEREPVWKELLPRVINAGLLEVDDDTLHRILG